MSNEEDRSRSRRSSVDRIKSHDRKRSSSVKRKCKEHTSSENPIDKRQKTLKEVVKDLEKSIKKSTPEQKKRMMEASADKDKVTKDETEVPSYILRLENKMDEMIKKMENIDKLREDVETVRSEVGNLRTLLKENSGKVEDAINLSQFVEEKIKKTDEELDKTKSTVKDIASKVDDLSVLQQEIRDIKKEQQAADAYSRRANIIIDGLKETEKENCLEVVMTMFETNLKIVDAKNSVKVDQVHRIGTKHAGKARPMIVRFMSVKDRMIPWAKKRELTGSGIWLNEDYPPTIRRIRRLLYKVRKENLKKDRDMYVRYDKLIYKGKPYDIDHLPEELVTHSLQTNVEAGFVLFHGQLSKFSNFNYAPFTIDGRQFNRVEQYFQFKKAADANQSQIARKILIEEDPANQKSLGDSVKATRNWMQGASRDVMKAALRAKFAANPIHHQALINTKGKRLVETTEYDKWWGNGLKFDDSNRCDPTRWRGQNHMGMLLDEIRHEYFT